MYIRFRCDSGQAANLRLRVYSQDRATLVATFLSSGSPNPFTEQVSGSYRCDVGNITGSPWFAQVTYIDTDEIAADGFVGDSGELIDQPLISFSVLPGRDRGLPQSNKGRIVVAQGERITISRQVVDGNGNAVTLTGRTLQFVVQDAREIDIAVISSGSITISGSTYSFTVPAAASARVGNYSYALNDVGTSKALLASGDWIVEARPLADS